VVGAILLAVGRKRLDDAKGCLRRWPSLLVIPVWRQRIADRSGGWRVCDADGGAGGLGSDPVHLNELSADAARGLMPGLAYQLGILFASPTNSIEYARDIGRL